MGRGPVRLGCVALAIVAVATLATDRVAGETGKSSPRVAPAAHGAPIPIPADALPAVQSLDISQGPVLAPPANSVNRERVALDPPLTRRGAGKARSDDTPGNEHPPEDASRTDADDEPPQIVREEEFAPKWRPPSEVIEEAFGLHSPTKTETDSSGRRHQPAPSASEMPQLDSATGGTPAKSASPQPFEADDDVRPLVEGEGSAAEPPSRESVSRQRQEKPDGSRAKSPTTEAAEPIAKQVLRPLTRNEILLRNRIRKVLSFYQRRPLNSSQHDSWEVMHWVLAYGLDSQIRQGGPRGEPITAIGWLCYNRPCKNKQLLRINEEGEIRALYGVGLQGHMGQFLAMLAQSNVDRNYPIVVDGKSFSILDLIEAEKKTCYTNSELTFKLISLMHYLPSDDSWVNDRGESWNIERLIEEELKQPIRGAACGGTHRLAGLSLAARKRELRGEPVEGVWARAAEFTTSYERYAYRLQNSDGSFSTQWFKGAGSERDIDRRIKTSGHILEWLIYHSTDEQLDNPRLLRGVNYLTNLLYSQSNHDWEIGPHCHALNALQLYNRRKFAPYDDVENVVASQRSEGGRTRERRDTSAGRPRAIRGR